MSEVMKNMLKDVGEPLLKEESSLGYPRADLIGHRMVIHELRDDQVILLDSLHPSVRGNLSRARDLRPGTNPDPFVVATWDEVREELAFMANEGAADGAEESIHSALSSGDLEPLGEALLLRALIRSFLGRDVVPDHYMSTKEAIADAWDNNAANITGSDGYQITCPHCFTLLPVKGVCDCQD